MSMIGDFGVCTKSSYNSLVDAIRNDQFDVMEDLIQKIYSELENSASALENNKCSGEVFLAVFHYFKTEYGMDMRDNADLKKLNENWREITGDYDMVIVTDEQKTKILSIADHIDYNKVIQFVNDFFQDDYGNAGQIACDVFFENVRNLKPDSILLWHLC